MCTEQITRARTTTAAATPRANARRPKTEELRVAIARLAMSTMARIAAQVCACNAYTPSGSKHGKQGKKQT